VCKEGGGKSECARREEGRMCAREEGRVSVQGGRRKECVCKEGGGKNECVKRDEKEECARREGGGGKNKGTRGKHKECDQSPFSPSH